MRLKNILIILYPLISKFSFSKPKISKNANFRIFWSYVEKVAHDVQNIILQFVDGIIFRFLIVIRMLWEKMLRKL